MSDMAVVVLAAGKGTRMGGETPKVLRKVWGRPLVEYLLDTIDEVGLGAPVVITGHGEAEVRRVLTRRTGQGFRFVHQTEQKGTGNALLAVRDQAGDLTGSLLILYGDVPGITPDTLRSFIEAAGDGPCLVTMEPDTPLAYGRILRDADGFVAGIREERHASAEEKAIREVNAGVYVVPAKSLFDVLDELPVHEESGETYLTDVAEILYGRGEKVQPWKAPHAGEFLGVNRPRDLAAVSALLEEAIVDRHIRAGVDILDPSKVAIDHGVKIGKGATIHPFVTLKGDVDIGAGAEILPFTVIQEGARVGAECMVGPFSHLRDGTVLDDRAQVGNFVETKNAHLGEGTKAKHLSYLGDVTIGARANIGAGTIVANYDGKAKHKTEIGEKAFIGSGTIFVAPVKVGREATTGAGAVVTRGQDVADGDVVVGVPARRLEKGPRGKGPTKSEGNHENEEKADGHD